MRFKFGKNWKAFSKLLDQDRIDAAGESLVAISGINSFVGKRFLDIGSGSGLFSLVANMYGASVCSFDYDQDSVSCTNELKKRFQCSSAEWTVTEGSVLDDHFMSKIGKYDIVYSWGVLHHTGDMWKALSNSISVVEQNGLLCIALYNDQGVLSKYWTAIKYAYNKNAALRTIIIVSHLPYLLLRVLARAVKGSFVLDRGMSIWYDMIDWLGGYPFEVATPADVVEFCSKYGLYLIRIKTVGGKQGCNEYVFQKV